MKLKEALEKEKDRKDVASQSRIFLHKDGMFYHAYDWSAWLVKTFVCTDEFQQQRGDDGVLQVSRYITKHTEYIMLGFPIESISKYITTYDDMRTIEDNTMIVNIKLDGDVSAEQLIAAYEEWAKDVPVKQTKPKNFNEVKSYNDKSGALGRSGVFAILSKVLSYPVEKMTPADNIEFISNIKSEIVGLL